MKQSVFLCGFMGVGKSTVGKFLAAELRVPFYDTDQMICETAGATVAEIFARGEDVFRKMETEQILNLAKMPPGAVALGGGALKVPQNLSAIRQTGVLVYLYATPETLAARLGDAADRPLLAGTSGAGRLAKIAELLRERDLVYKAADTMILTDGKSPEAVSREIIRELEKRTA